MNIKLLSNNVLIKPIEEENIINGIIIPDIAKQKAIRGKVIAIGQGSFTSEGILLPIIVKINDIVLFEKYATKEIEIENKKYLLVSEDNIYMIEE